MSGATVADFLGYWEREGEAYVRHGDYDWMAGLVPGRRVLEIGCGVGHSTQALLRRGLSVLAVDSLPACLDATRARVGDAAELLPADLAGLGDGQRARIAAFAPDVVVCWLMGAPAEVTGASAGDGGKAVVAYRTAMHRRVAELAAGLPTVAALHLVDRTAIAWQAKDIGRDTLVRYHLGSTLAGLPLTAVRANALYRKLEDNPSGRAAPRHPSLPGVLPVLASLLAERKN